MTVLSDCAVTIIMGHDTQGGSKFIMLFREAQELHMIIYYHKAMKFQKLLLTFHPYIHFHFK